MPNPPYMDSPKNPQGQTTILLKDVPAGKGERA